jgi:hypothetical protein
MADPMSFSLSTFAVEIDETSTIVFQGTFARPNAEAIHIAERGT